MSKTLAYLRASTDKQDLSNQKLEILEFARKKDFKVDDFIEIIISSRKNSKQRRGPAHITCPTFGKQFLPTLGAIK